MTAPRRTKPLEPLAHKRTRVKLLASSYLDACETSGHRHDADIIHGSSSTQRPQRNVDLWARGSYPQFEKALSELRLEHARTVLDFWTIHVREKRIDNDHRQQRARFALTYVTTHMPATVHVPADISQNAGYILSEALAYERPRSKREAAA